MTPAQIKRDNFLHQLAYNPSEALRQWSRLTNGERTVVALYMGGQYTVEFAQQFLKEANKRKRLTPGLTITNSPDVTPETLKIKGYKFKGNPGGIQEWVHPNGEEVWLLSRPKTGSPPPAVTPPTPPHANVEEVKLYVQEYGDEKNDQIRRSRELARMKGKISPQEYARLRQQWIDDYEKWEEDLDDKINNVIPSQTGPMTEQEKAVRQSEIDHLKKIHTEGPGDWFPPNAD